MVAQMAALQESSDGSSGAERRSSISDEETEVLDTKVLEPITLKK